MLFPSIKPGRAIGRLMNKLHVKFQSDETTFRIFKRVRRRQLIDKAKLIEWLQQDSVLIIAEEAIDLPMSVPGVAPIRTLNVVLRCESGTTFETMPVPAEFETAELTEEQRAAKKKEIEEGWGD